MRLPTNVRFRFLALGLTALVAACARGGNDLSTLASAADSASYTAAGPEADYPVVVGDPYSIDGTVYTPLDTMNYDEVGYAVTDPEGGGGVTVAHRTLPMPSYVEITALDTGKTILARVERRGPMSGNGVVALSAGARQQLEVGASAPIRIRRVNAAESDRSKLRVGEAAPDRMDTPKSLLAVLKRKLPADGAVSLASAQQSVPAAQELPANPPKLAAANPPSAHVVAPPAPKAAVVQAAKPGNSFEQAFSTAPKVVKSYPLPPLGGQQIAKAPAPVRVAAAPVAAPKVTPVEKPNIAAPVAAVKGNFVIQAAAFSSKANAQRVANSIDGFVQQSGSLYRVRKGPFANRGQAEAALAKVRAAGYSDARVFTAG